MSRYLLAVSLMVAFALSATAAVKSKPFRVRFDWRAKAAVGRHTSLLATFDDKERLVADRARGDAAGGSYRVKLGAPGKWGRALELTEKGSIAHFRAGPSVNSRHGTIDLWVRSKPGTNLWRDGREHWLLCAEGASLSDGLVRHAAAQGAEVTTAAEG